MLTMVASSATISWASAMKTRAIQRRSPLRAPSAGRESAPGGAPRDVVTVSFMIGISFFHEALPVTTGTQI